MTKKIWLDAGHGGKDPGAVGNGLHEADVNLKITKYAEDYLKDNYEGHEIRLTRGSDKNVALSKRDDLADNWGADVFLSIHINAGGGDGFESYVYPNVGPETISLQNMVHGEVLKEMRRFLEVRDRGKKRANFSVLRETEMPAVLTENLFIDTKSNANLLKKESFLMAVGKGHAVGLAKWLGLKEKPKPKPKPKQETKEGLWKVQVGAFKNKENARDLVKRLEKDGYNAFMKFE